jgi:predicted DNA-binding ribbon-helix-helix protein
MKSVVVKRSIVISSHKTSVSLEDAFWGGLKEIALARGLTVSELVTIINSGRAHGNLSSAIRLACLITTALFCRLRQVNEPPPKSDRRHNPASLPSDRR